MAHKGTKSTGNNEPEAVPLTDNNSIDDLESTVSTQKQKGWRHHLKKRKITIIIFLLCVCVSFLIGYFVGKQNLHRDSHVPASSNQNSQGLTYSKKNSTVECYLKLTEMVENVTFAERCKHGSHFVNWYCDPMISTHRCAECDGKMIPKFCFCDNQIHCQSNPDLLRKKTCSECAKEISCPCMNGGNCTCKSGAVSAEDIHCECQKGYSGQYCEKVTSTVVRVCSHSSRNSEIKCTAKDMNDCNIYSTYLEQNVTCRLVKDKCNIQKLENCI